MKRTVLFAVLCAVGVPTVAQTTTTYTFAAVDAVKMDYTELQVTGVLEGSTDPIDITVSCRSAASYGYCTQQMEICNKYALLAMMKPGQYQLQWEPYWYGDRCALKRVSP